MGLAGSLYRVEDSLSCRVSLSRTSISRTSISRGTSARGGCEPTILHTGQGVHQFSYPSNPASAYLVDHFRRPNVEIKDIFSSLFLYNHLDDEFPYLSRDVEMRSHST